MRIKKASCSNLFRAKGSRAQKYVVSRNRKAATSSMRQLLYKVKGEREAEREREREKERERERERERETCGPLAPTQR